MHVVAVLLSLLMGLASRPAVAADTIPIGMSTALSGPTAALGLNMQAGVLAAFDEVNREGGIGGRPLELIALDDRYEPQLTVPNMHRLTNEHKVLAVIGNVGTPTTVTAIPIAIENQTPLFAAFTGASVLRKIPPDRYIINYRASYAEETAAMVTGLIEAGVRPGEIAFFTQNDSYGDDGYYGGYAAIRRYAPEITSSMIAHGRYERNTSNVESALADLLIHSPPPKAVIMVGAYAPCAKFVRLAQENMFTPRFLSVSFVGVDPLLAALGESAEGLIVTQVVPHFDADLPIVARYRNAIRATDADAPLSFGSLEGYVAASIMIRALHTIEGEITREAIVDALEGLGDFDIGLGVPLSLGPECHQASTTVWPTVLHSGEVLPLDWRSLDEVEK